MHCAFTARRTLRKGKRSVITINQDNSQCSKSVIHTLYPFSRLLYVEFHGEKLFGWRGRRIYIQSVTNKGLYMRLLCMEELPRRTKGEQSFIASNILWKFPSLLHFCAHLSCRPSAQLPSTSRIPLLFPRFFSLFSSVVLVPGPFTSGPLSYRLHTESVQEQQQARTSVQCLCRATTDWYHDRLPTHFQKGWTAPRLPAGL